MWTVQRNTSLSCHLSFACDSGCLLSHSCSPRAARRRVAPARPAAVPPPPAWPPPAPSRVPSGRLPGMCLHAGLPASLLLGHLPACREPRGRAEDTGGTFLRSRQGQPTSLVIAGDSGKDGDKNGGNIDGQPPPPLSSPHPVHGSTQLVRSSLTKASCSYIYIYQGLLSFNI